MELNQPFYVRAGIIHIRYAIKITIRATMQVGRTCQVRTTIKLVNYTIMIAIRTTTANSATLNPWGNG